VRMCHSDFTIKQVPKVVGVSYMGYLPASSNLKPSQCQKPGRRSLLERSSHLLSPPQTNPAGLNALTEVNKWD
jgi:hypothetical protein